MENLRFEVIKGYFHVLVFYELFYKGNRKQFFPVFPYSYMQGRREKFCASSKKKCIGPYSSEKCIKGPHGSDKATSYRGARVANAVSALPFTSESEVNGRVYSWIGEHLGIAPGPPPPPPSSDQVIETRVEVWENGKLISTLFGVITKKMYL